jgi:hypothetical protein
MCLLALALGLGGMYVSWLRHVSAYLQWIFGLVVAFGILGIATIGRLPGEGTHYPALIGAIAGLMVGIGTGIYLGRKAVHSNWIYWLGVVLVMAIFITVPFWRRP